MSELFFIVRYYVEPSYTTKSYAPDYYNNEAPKWVHFFSLICSQFQSTFFFLFSGITLNQIITNRPKPLPFIIRTRQRQHPVITSPRFPTQRLPLLILITPKRTQLPFRFTIRRNQSAFYFLFYSSLTKFIHFVIYSQVLFGSSILFLLNWGASLHRHLQVKSGL